MSYDIYLFKVRFPFKLDEKRRQKIGTLFFLSIDLYQRIRKKKVDNKQ